MDLIIISRGCCGRVIRGTCVQKVGGSNVGSGRMCPTLVCVLNTRSVNYNYERSIYIYIYIFVLYPVSCIRETGSSKTTDLSVCSYIYMYIYRYVCFSSQKKKELGNVYFLPLIVTWH